MRATLGFICLAFSLTGAGAQSDDKPQVGDRTESEPRIDQRGDVARPEKTDPLRDKPVSARETQQRDREEGARGGTTPLE